MRNPFNKISADEFKEGFEIYPAIEKMFNWRFRRLINNRLITFYTLPRIFQWIIQRGMIAEQKLQTLDRALTFLIGKNRSLDKKIQEIARLQSDPEIFQALTEFLVIYKILCSKKISNFEYEEYLGFHLPKYDINLDYNGKRVRIDVTHKEDVYSLQNTVGTLFANLMYANPKIGGRIRYAAPAERSVLDGTVTYSKNMTEIEVRQTIENAISVMSSLTSGSAEVECPSPFFQITIDSESRVWTARSGLHHRPPAIDLWNSPDINGYVKGIKKKAEKSSKIKDGAHKIIAVDYIPASDLHNGYYRNQLLEQLTKDNLLGDSHLDEIFTFSMRFETGEFDDLSLLWQRNPSNPSIFPQIVL
jgi:hypothetical protein